jgi:hypothetical protein
MARKSSKWELSILEEDDGILEVRIKGPSKKVSDLMMLEVLMRGLRSWDSDVDFKEGVMPKDITKTWYLPVNAVKAKMNPAGKKTKIDTKISPDDLDSMEHAFNLYREFNGIDASEVKIETTWLPDEQSPLVAIGEGTCPFVGYTSGKTNKGGELDTYIHHFGEDEDSKITLERPRIYVTVPPPGYKPILLILGGVFAIEDRVDPKTGEKLKWLVR